MGPVQPSGTVTLVFTDIEGSTRLLATLGPEEYRAVLEQHRGVVRKSFVGGYEVDCEGDSFFYAFVSAGAAADAVTEAMRALDGGAVRIRVGVHTGDPTVDPPRYVGLDVHKAARIMAAAHGGQVLVSHATCALLDARFTCRDLGEHRLKDFAEPQRLHQLLVPGLPDAFPPLRTQSRSTLPVPATAFVGRGREVTELRQLLTGGVPLVTLTGPGGTGKTRLAVESAAGVAAEYPDGVWWIPLASLTDPQLVLDSVARALEVPEQAGGDVAATLRDFLTGRRALLLLDNLEHLLPAAADALAALLATNGPTLLVTSRERLRLDGEHAYPVAPLEEPDGVELFLRRAVAAGWTGTDTGAVAELCVQLDNLPLAIELASARAPLLEPGELLARLGSRLDRLKGARNTDARQQTLRATIDWSYDLLERHEQELFARMAVMTGGATLDTIEEVCDADLDTLQALLDKSLIRRTGDRYWMLETIREYATERLEASGEAESLRGRHLGHFEALARAVAPPAAHRDQPATLERLDAELQNFRAALAWAAASGRVDAGGRLASALGWFWEARGHLDEGVRSLSAFAEDADVDPAVRAPALFWLARLRLWTAEWDEADRHLVEAVRLSREAGLPGTLAISLGKRGWIASELGRPLQEASPFVDEAVAIARPLGEEWTLAEALNDLGAILSDQPEGRPAARAAFREALELRRRLGDAQNVIDSLNNLANVDMYDRRFDEAERGFRECYELACGLGERRHQALTGANLGTTLLMLGRVDEARLLLEETAALCLSCGDRRIGGAALHALAGVRAFEGELLDAARLWGAGGAVVGTGASHDDALLWDPFLVEARDALGPAAFDAAVADGRSLGFEEAVALTRTRATGASVR